MHPIVEAAGRVAFEFVKANKKEIVKWGFRIGGTGVLYLMDIWKTKKKKEVRSQTSAAGDNGFAADANNSNTSEQNSPEPPKQKERSASTTFSEMAHQTGKIPNPIITGVLYPGDMCLLAGENHSGKSLLMYHIGLCLAEGKPLNLTEEKIIPEDKYVVLMYDRENSNAVLSRRYGALDVKNFRIIRGMDFTTTDDLLDDLELQLEAIPQDRDVLACIDNATAFKMPTSGPKITDFYTRLQSIIDHIQIEDKRLTVIIAAHLSSIAAGKRDDARVLGATQLISGASANLYIKNTRFGKHKKILKATKNRLGDCPEDVFLLNIVDEAPWHFVFERMIDEADALPLPNSHSHDANPSPDSSHSKSNNPVNAPQEETKKAIIIRLAMEGKTKMEIHVETGISRPTIDQYWPKDIPTKRKKTDK